MSAALFDAVTGLTVYAVMLALGIGGGYRMAKYRELQERNDNDRGRGNEPERTHLD